MSTPSSSRHLLTVGFVVVITILEIYLLASGQNGWA
jgi:hypothetical protein